MRNVNTNLQSLVKEFAAKYLQLFARMSGLLADPIFSMMVYEKCIQTDHQGPTHEKHFYASSHQV